VNDPSSLKWSVNSPVNKKTGYKIQNHSSVQPLFFFNIDACITRSNRRPYRQGESVLKNMQKPEKPALGCHFRYILEYGVLFERALGIVY
jgi:hypothetical protein